MKTDIVQAWVGFSGAIVDYDIRYDAWMRAYRMSAKAGASESHAETLRFAAEQLARAERHLSAQAARWWRLERERLVEESARLAEMKAAAGDD